MVSTNVVVPAEAFSAELVEAIALIARFGGYTVLPCEGLADELVPELNKTMAKVKVKATKLPTWRLDDGSPLAGFERVRFEAVSP